METLGEAIQLEPIQYEDPQVNYSELPDEDLLPTADAILDALMQMTEKLRKFIRQNNAYGTAYQYVPKRSFKRSEDEDDQFDLDCCLKAVQKALDKKYVVDLFEDGTEEIQEMLRTVWKAIDG